MGLLAFLVVLGACSSNEPEVIEMGFGLAEWDFASNAPANDYIADFLTSVPTASQKCKLDFLGFNTFVSDGGEIAYFDAHEAPDEAIACLQSIFPHGRFISISQSNWRELKEEVLNQTDMKWPVPASSYPYHIVQPPRPSDSLTKPAED